MSDLAKVLSLIQLRCLGTTINGLIMLENLLKWLKYNNSAKMSELKFLHSNV